MGGEADHPVDHGPASLDLILSEVRHARRNNEHAINGLAEKVEKFGDRLERLVEESRKRELQVESRMVKVEGLEVRVAAMEREVGEQKKRVSAAIGSSVASLVTFLLMLLAWLIKNAFSRTGGQP